MIEILFIYQLTRGAGDRAALVLPQPVPRFARQAPMPRMHQIVKRGLR
jgi:hypothetical protein